MNGDPVARVALRIGDERHWLRVREVSGGDQVVVLAGQEHEVRLGPGPADEITGTIDGRPVAARVEYGPGAMILRRQCLRFEVLEDDGASHRASAEYEGHLKAPMPGHVLDVRATVGARVAAGEVLVVLEAMKMEHSLPAPRTGRIGKIEVEPGQQVSPGQLLISYERGA